MRKSTLTSSPEFTWSPFNSPPKLSLQQDYSGPEPSSPLKRQEGPRDGTGHITQVTTEAEPSEPQMTSSEQDRVLPPPGPQSSLSLPEQKGNRKSLVHVVFRDLPSQADFGHELGHREGPEFK